MRLGIEVLVRSIVGLDRVWIGLVSVTLMVCSDGGCVWGVSTELWKVGDKLHAS